MSEKVIVIESLKKRCAEVYRAVPVPGQLLDELDMVHRLRGKGSMKANATLWEYSRTTAWRRIKTALELAGIDGAHANPKGLRHGFGVAHALSKTPLPLLQRWMGHSSPETTAISMQVTGEEERKLAGAAW